MSVASPTLEQLGVTMILGFAVSTTTLLLFAGALKLRISHIAPRCEARPRDVIYNPNPDCDERQRKGNPFLLGWAFWLLSLSYHTMIEGVPGTGTRNDGLSGTLLRVNLDSIVLLRFHALGLRISTFAASVYCIVALPIYVTSRCFDTPFETDKELALNCTVEDSYNLTRYDRMTLANVPPINEAYAFEGSEPNVYIRLYVIVLCSYLVCWFTCYELHKEWIDLLAMRRVYYLEYNHWKGRREELKAVMTDVDDEINNHANNSPSQDHHEYSQNPHLHQRPVWIPHPEQRDTPPSIELYSVLVGALPKRPRQAISDEDLEAAMTDEEMAVDWQLSVTSAFFDYCVPNQPGFSSSVAAVTILPSASELAMAWKKWYGATKKLQRLRFIRRQLLDRGYRELDTDNNDQEEMETANKIDDSESREDDADIASPLQAQDGKSFDVYLQSSSRRDEYIQEILGCITDGDVENMFLKSLQMGPEQTAAYSLELAKGSSRCCPHGFCEEQILCSNVEQLEKMEVVALQQASDAFLQLEVARREAAQAVHEQTDQTNCPRRPRAFLLNKETPASDQTTKMVEAKLFGEGRATLETAATDQQKMSNELRSRHSRGRNRQQQQFQGQRMEEGIESYLSTPSMESTSSDVAGPGVPAVEEKENKDSKPGRQRPSIKGGGSAFPSLLQIKTATSIDQDPASENQWDDVMRAANESEIGADDTGKIIFHHKVSDGVWNMPSFRQTWVDFWEQTRSLLGWTITSSDMATDLLARDSSFAVVTFTSRQAAIAARKCLADGRGAGRWKTIEDIPVAPLADASAFNICDCRGCMRPVTISLNDHQKIWRNYCSKATLAVIYVFYTIPITYAATFGSETVTDLLPEESWITFDSTELFGLIRGWLISLFLAVCPQMFLFIANFGSNASSMVEAEFAAIQYFWWFFLLFALVGSSVAQMVMRAFEEGSFNIVDTLQTVAATIPSQVSSNWANWIILKAMVFHPLFYLLQLNSFLFAALGCRCCLRLVRGGGAGNRVPYRWYVESGVVLMFVLALAPAAPIVAPLAVMYFIICNPILRHLLIFTYKPQFDAGGIRFPFLFDMCISSLLVSQLLLTVMMALKGVIGPAVFAGILGIPVLVFRRAALKRFLSAYQDAALLQTSLLDGQDAPEDSIARTVEGREEFRRFLVDCHRAAYVPICIAGTNTDKILTAEPAVVVPSDTDTDYAKGLSDKGVPSVEQSYSPKLAEAFKRSQHNVGAIMRRNLTGSTMGASTREKRSQSQKSRDDGQGKADSVSDEHVNLVSLHAGRIREGENGEMFIVDNGCEIQKDK